MDVLREATERKKEQMAIDIEALKAKLDKMNNKGRPAQGQMKSDLWVPEYGSYVVRPVPWPKSDRVDDGSPFMEIWFYYGLSKKAIAPKLGSPDPVRELRDSLFEDRSESNLETAKKLRPKMRCFLPVIVEEEGKKSIKFWGMSPTVYKKLLSFVVDPDYGDIADVTDGYDIKVTIADSGKKFPDGTVIRDVDVQPKPKSRKLSGEELELLKTMPDINVIYPVSSYDELASLLEKFINGASASGGETSRGATPAAAARTTSKPASGNLDAAFDDLLA